MLWMACVGGLIEKGRMHRRTRRVGPGSITSRTYARMVENNQGHAKPERKGAISLSEGHRSCHANQLAAFPLFSFEFTCSCQSMAFSPPLSFYFSARGGRGRGLAKSWQDIFLPDWSFLVASGVFPLPLLFQDCAVHTCPRVPASALFIRGGLGPIVIPTEQVPTQYHWRL